MSDSSEFEDINNTPPDILEQVNVTLQSLLPKSLKKNSKNSIYISSNGPKKSIFVFTQKNELLFERCGKIICITWE
jgi:hypothetical protein